MGVMPARSLDQWMVVQARSHEVRYVGPVESTIELPRVGDPGTDKGGAWRVIVLNDDHNTFDGVANALSRVIPGVSLDQGYAIADRIHNTGQAIVWSGQL